MIIEIVSLNAVVAVNNIPEEYKIRVYINSKGKVMAVVRDEYIDEIRAIVGDYGGYIG